MADSSGHNNKRSNNNLNVLNRKKWQGISRVLYTTEKERMTTGAKGKNFVRSRNNGYVPTKCKDIVSSMYDAVDYEQTHKEGMYDGQYMATLYPTKTN